MPGSLDGQSIRLERGSLHATFIFISYLILMPYGLQSSESMIFPSLPGVNPQAFTYPSTSIQRGAGNHPSEYHPTVLRCWAIL
ncbi:hypothetical protein BDR05DRAFT_760504 [Suillus weaverae]|nr:hypothetical protein BDR05DRAFT_760504 [Suillus weaverae]